VPAFAQAPALLETGAGRSGGARNNRAYAERFTTFASAVSEAHRWLLCDPCTSGGLLVALPRPRAAEIDGTVIGTLNDGRAGAITVL
jgi:selenophosphate synthase